MRRRRLNVRHQSAHFLADLLDMANGKAPATEAAQASVDAARAGRTIAGLRPNPTAQTQVENVAGSNSYGGFQQAETTVMLNVPIELGRKRSARIAQADARTDRALIEAAVAQADLRYQVTQLYIDAVAVLRRQILPATNCVSRGTHSTPHRYVCDQVALSSGRAACRCGADQCPDRARSGRQAGASREG
jgi:cobalt-zinc-cadmium efflux system outer membrane protein